MRVSRLAAVSLSAGAVLGTAAAALMMAAAWDHNPQEEFHGAGGVRWGAWLGIGRSWFVVTAPLGAALAYAAGRVIRHVRREDAEAPNA